MTPRPRTLLPSLPPPLAGACLFAAAMLAVFPAAPQAHGYRLDPVHTRILVGIDHAGFSTALGTVSGSTGALAFDPADWGSARLDVEIPLDRIDFGDEGWNRAARRMLDVERFPRARFVSAPAAPVPLDPAAAAVDPAAAAPMSVCGTLTLHGVARPLCLQATLNRLERQPVPPFRRTAGFSASATLSRSDFGIDAWKSMVGDEVALRIEVEAVRDGDALQTLAVPAAVEAPPTP